MDQNICFSMRSIHDISVWVSGLSVHPLFLVMCNITCVLFPTGYDIKPMSDTMLFTMKLKEKGELTKELQLMTSQRNELQERLVSITEGTVDNRYPSFQTSWGCQQCHPHLLSLWVLASTVTSDVRF